MTVLLCGLAVGWWGLSRAGRVRVMAERVVRHDWRGLVEERVTRGGFADYDDGRKEEAFSKSAMQRRQEVPSYSYRACFACCWPLNHLNEAVPTRRRTSSEVFFCRGSQRTTKSVDAE
jgi:hypothetical protein